MISQPSPSARPPWPVGAPRFDAAARRRAPRARVAYGVRLRCEGAELSGTTTDVSMVGLFVATRQFLRDGTRVQVWFAVGPGGRARVEAEGWVVRRVTFEQATERGGVAGMGIALDRFRSGREELRSAIDVLLWRNAADDRGLARHPGETRPGTDPDAIDELALDALAALQAEAECAVAAAAGGDPTGCLERLQGGDLDATLPLLRFATLRERGAGNRWLRLAATGLKAAALAVALLVGGFGFLLVSLI